MSSEAEHKRTWVTQRVRDALASGSNTELLKALVEAFPGSWFFTRLDATFAFVNQTACDTLGYTRDELMALTLYDVDPSLTPEIWNGLLAMGPYIPAAVRTLHRRKDGTVFPVEAFGSRIILGEENVAVSYVIDLSQEAQTREALAEKELLLQSLLDNAPVLLWFIGRDGHFQLCEGSALALLGLEPRQVVGQTVAGAFPDVPDLAAATERALQGSSVEGIVAIGGRQFEYRYLPRRDADGKVVGVAGVAIDVTARRSAEERLRQVERMDAVGQLAGGLAHDFNNLLQIILGNSNLCLAHELPAPVGAALAEIREAGWRATGLVGQLLTFNRAAGKPKSVDLGRLVGRILPLLRRLLGEHIFIEIDVRPSGTAVWGDESQLEQIVVNLCVNARDAMPQGGRLQLVVGPCEVDSARADRLGLRGPGHYVALEVTDTGSGMSEEVQRHAFELFFTTKAPGAGSGLGLPTVYTVAKRHGGGVEVDSQVGQGSRFRVFLRASDRAAETPAPEARPLIPIRRRLRILMAEDDEAVREIARRFLVEEGHEVVAVRDGAEAIALFKAQGAPFELVVLDAIMPRVNGAEVYGELRANSAVPVLFVTGHAFNALDGLPADRACAVLRKPFDAPALSAAIHRLLDGAAAAETRGTTGTAHEQ